MGSVRRVITEASWTVQRHGEISEEILTSGAIRFHVQIWDEDRQPFISRWFNDIVPAADFLDRVQAGVEMRRK